MQQRNYTLVDIVSSLNAQSNNSANTAGLTTITILNLFSTTNDGMLLNDAVALAQQSKSTYNGKNTFSVGLWQ